MQRFRTMLLEVWREVCRHVEVHESTATVASLLARQMPLRQLSLWLLEPEHSAAVAVTFAPAAAEGSPPEGKQVFTATQWKKILRWCGAGQLAHGGPGSKGELSLLLADSAAGDAIGVPLSSQGQPMGYALLTAREGKQFDDEDLALLESLREPLSVALENDRRLHEMASLREAAEAERGALLRRLGRSDLGDTIVGETSGLRQVMERVDLVSRSDVPVLILGETGTGKEVVARAIHSRSGRRGGPFLRVNCGAIPPELIDSQLFGHERGSFTGADQSRPGWFERADRGTLFLDEIGELPLEAQVRFLRVLQDGFVERVGSHQAIHVDVRIIAATHRDLATMVHTREFREDLWYRLAVFPILLPPLDERRDDIPALARHFAARAAVRFGLAPASPSDEDIRLLQTYDWPGNIRELGTVIDRAAILGDGQRLEIAKALGVISPSPGSVGPSSKSTPAVAPVPAATGSSNASVSLDEAIRDHIGRALAATRGRIEGPQGAARLLKINPHTLRAKMRKLGLDWKQFRE